MNRRGFVTTLAPVIIVACPWPLYAMGDDDPLLTMLKLDKLEIAVDEDPTPQRLEVQAWAGHDLNRLWLKSDVEREGGHTESADIELLYSRAVAPYWDFQLGWKHDFQPSPDRDWLAIGFQGLAPYFFEVDAALYLGESGHSSFEFSAEYELLFTQRLILSPELELVFNGYNEQETGNGSGLSTAEFGLRLRYEIRREFAPYIGIEWHRAYGNTADFQRQAGEDTDDLVAVIGIRAWF